MTNAFGAIDLFSGSKSISGTDLFGMDKNPLNVLSTDFASLPSMGATLKSAFADIIENMPELIAESFSWIADMPAELLEVLTGIANLHNLPGSGLLGGFGTLLAVPLDFINNVLNFFGLGSLGIGSAPGTTTIGSTLGTDVADILAIPFDFINAVLGALGLGSTGVGVGASSGTTLGGSLGTILSDLSTFLADTGLSGAALAALITNLSTDVSTVVSDLDTLFTLTSTTATSLAALINALAPGAVASLTSLLALLGLPDVPSLASFITSINPNFLPIIPAAHIRNVNPELLFNPGFDTSASIGSGVGFSWDGTVGHLNPGSAKAAADGATKIWMVSNPIAVAQGDQIAMSIWVQWSSLTTSGSSPAPLRLEVQPYGTILFTFSPALHGKGTLTAAAVATKFSGLSGHPTGRGTLSAVVQAQNTTTHVYNRYATLHGKGALTATASMSLSRQTIALHGRGTLSATAKAVFTNYADIPTVLQSVASPATNSGWTQLKGTYPVPAGVNTVYLQPVVDTTATAGSVWFDDGSITKAGDLVGGTGLIDTMANLFTNLFGGNTLSAELTQLVIPHLTAGWGKTIDGSLLSGITAVEQQIVDALTQGFGQGTGHSPGDLQGFLSTALGDLLPVTTWNTFLADANTALDTAGSDLASFIGGLQAIPFPNVLSVLGAGSLGDDLSDFVSAINTAATVTGGPTTASFSNALAGIAALLGFNTAAAPPSGSVAGVTTTNSTYIANRAATKGTYIGVDPTGDPTFNFSQLAGAALPTINVSAGTSILGLIGTPDGGTKKSVAWYAPNALPVGITSVTINVYSVNLSTGECDLLSSSGNISGSVISGWNYYDLASINYVNAQQGLWYAVEMCVTGSGSYPIAGLQHQGAAHPFAIPGTMAATRSFQNDITTTQSGTAVPAGVLGCIVRLIGGGGGGHGGGTSGSYGGGGGGGGGVLVSNFIPVVSLGGTFSCSPGAAGSAGAAAGNGGNGGASTFSSGSISLSAGGGAGATSNATAGAGGTNSISGATASLNASGTAGGNGASSSGSGSNAANNSAGSAPGGGGGAITGNGGNGGNSLTVTGGAGGVGQTNGSSPSGALPGYPGGGGGGGGAASSAGNAGTGATGGSYGGGGGGGGGKAGVSGNSAGGAGGVGGVVITWISAPASITPTYTNANTPFLELCGSAGPVTHAEDPTTFTSNGTYTVPAWANYFDVVIVGAGGGAHAWTGLAGHGGGAGSWNAATYTAAQVGSTMAITVGAAGAGGINGGSAATNGGSTSVNTNGSGGTLSASGGTAAANSSKTGLSPGNETFNSRFYQGGFEQNNTSGPGNSPGGGGAGGGQGGSLNGGNGAAGAVFILAYQ